VRSESACDCGGLLWLEFFTEGPLASTYVPYLKDATAVITPTVVLYEVYKVVKRRRGEERALAAAAQLGKTVVYPLTEAVALTAADVSLAYHVAMADAIVYATARTTRSTLVTSDEDLAPLPGVTYFRKR